MEVMDRYKNSFLLPKMKKFYLQKRILYCVKKSKEWEENNFYSISKELEETLVLLFKKEIITIQDLQKLGLSRALVDHVLITCWFSKHAYDVQNLKKMDDYHRALAIVGRIYAEKIDRSGYPQSKHLISVSNAMDTVEEQIVGLLHDVVEDGYLTLTNLLFLGFSTNIIRAVAVLTRDKYIHPTYDSYIKNQILLSNSLLVLKTKLQDMLNNQSSGRVKYLPTKKARRKASTKYVPYIPLVKEKIKDVQVKKLERKRRVS